MTITIDELQRLADKIQLSGNMPKPKIRLLTECRLAKNINWWGYCAHAHSPIGATGRGWICFNPDHLDDMRSQVIDTLAHELAHLRYPKARHNARRFKEATEAYYTELMALQ